MLKPNFFYRTLIRNRLDESFQIFGSNPLTCDSALFPGKISPYSNRIFPGKRRGDKALILTYLDSPMADVLQRKTGN